MKITKNINIGILFIFSLLIAGRAEAVYIFEWQDAQAESYIDTNGLNNLNNVSTWDCYFTLDDAAMTFSVEGGYEWFSTSSEPIHFYLSGTTSSGQNFKATGFQMNSLIGYKDNGILFTDVGEFSFIVESPTWIYPKKIFKGDQDSWLYYVDTLYDPATLSMKEAIISHYGAFKGHQIGNNVPIPEPNTILLFGAGLAGLAVVGRRRRN
jgi:hypothetical protein